MRTGSLAIRMAALSYVCVLLLTQLYYCSLIYSPDGMTLDFRMLLIRCILAAKGLYYMILRHGGFVEYDETYVFCKYLYISCIMC